MEEVNFNCQRCGDPLKLDPTFSVVDDRLLTELASPLVSLKPATDNDPEVPECSTEGGVRRKYTDRMRYSQDNSYSVVIKSQNAPKEPGKFSQFIEMTAQLFDVLTDNSEIDHPLCGDCTDSLLDLMEKELSSLQDELKEYKVYLSEWKEPNENTEALEQQLKELEEQENALTEKISTAEKDRETVVAKRNYLLKEKDRLEAGERQLFREQMDVKRQWMLAVDEKMNVENQFHYAKKQLDLLTKTNVFNATFHIWHDGHFGTINGFRLGRLPDIAVDWSEINIAWGQTVLLLNSLAKLMNFTFKNYRLVPFGDRAHIEKYGEKGTERLPLYHVGGLRFLYDIKFDAGMVAFLDCLSQFKQMAEGRNENFRMPYSMENGRIRDNNSMKAYSVKHQMNSEEEWTKALKFMLTNLKWAVVAQMTNRS